MPEKVPTSASRSPENEQDKHTRIEARRKKGLNLYRELITHSNGIEMQIDAVLSQPPTRQSLALLAKLFEKKHAADELGYKLEETILLSLEQEDVPPERLTSIEEMLHAEQEN